MYHQQITKGLKDGWHLSRNQEKIAHPVLRGSTISKSEMWTGLSPDRVKSLISIISGIGRCWTQTKKQSCENQGFEAPRHPCNPRKTHGPSCNKTDVDVTLGKNQSCIPISGIPFFSDQVCSIFSVKSYDIPCRVKVFELIPMCCCLWTRSFTQQRARTLVREGGGKICSQGTNLHFHIYTLIYIISNAYPI